MFYPLKFKPVYKNYIWGGRNLTKLGKKLPEGEVAESWEVSCHPDGISVIANGELAGMSLPDYVYKFGGQAIGENLDEKYISRFPLMVKLIDANQKLSVQVHPDDAYALVHEKGESGKNEMWYIISAKPGAQIVYGIAQGVERTSFVQAITNQTLENCLNYLPVEAGDVIYIPAGMVHALGAGIVLVEVQQNSNSTYRIFDYGRKDAKGNLRPLHISKALDVIDFSPQRRLFKSKGLALPGDLATRTFIAVTPNFTVELLDIRDSICEEADGSKFFIYTILAGEGQLEYLDGAMSIDSGESMFIPAAMGKYNIKGNLKILKSYVPHLMKDVVQPLLKWGYSNEEIYEELGILI